MFLKNKVYHSHSLRETLAVASLMANKFAGAKERPLIIGLVGNLGSAKTAFAKMFLKTLGARGSISSPTFVLVREYSLIKGNYARAYHIDVYRLKNPKEIFRLILRGLINNKDSSIILIEWAERLKKFLPPQNTVWINFSHGEKFNEREIKIHLPGF